MIVRSNSMTPIPDSVQKLEYSRHALLERCKDLHGFIRVAPQAFYKTGCKSYSHTDDDEVFRAYYVYSDTHDICLIINKTTHVVVTNWLQCADNRSQKKGRFRFGFNAS